METVGDLSVCLVCQWWFCINIGRVRNKIHTVKYDFICLFSAAPWLMLWCEILILHTLQAEHMNYALSKKNLLPQVLYAFTQVLSLLPRWIANGEMFDGIELLTSLFRIQIFIFIVDPLSMKMFWTHYGFLKWNIIQERNAKHIMKPFISLIQIARLFQFSRNDHYLLLMLYFSHWLFAVLKSQWNSVLVRAIFLSVLGF